MKPLEPFQENEVLEKALFDLRMLRDKPLGELLTAFGLVYLDSILKQLNREIPSKTKTSRSQKHPS